MYLYKSRIALAQTTSVLGNVPKNVDRHVAIIEQAINDKATAIVFPELSLTGYTLRDINFDVALDPYTAEETKSLRALSREITIICGGVERGANGGVYNSAFVFENGEVLHVHRKVYPPTYGIFEEERYFLHGKDVRAFESARLGRIGVLVCEDIWHPSLPYLLAHQGAQLIVTIAASPTRLATGEVVESNVLANLQINREHHKSYARLHQVYLAFVNRIGAEDGINFWGGSEIVAPDGGILAEAPLFDDSLLIIDLDPNAVRHSRENSRHFLDENLLLTHQILGEIITTESR